MATLSIADRIRLRFQHDVGLPFERRVRVPWRRWRNASRVFRPVFVTGASGGGTSVLAVSLAQGWDCAGLVYECDAAVGEPSFLHVPALATYPSLAAYEAFIAPDAGWSVERGRADLQAMMRGHASAPGDAVVAKGPDIHLTRVAFLHGCFPEAVSVAVVRDPAANLEGMRRKWPLFGSAPLDECIAFFRRMHERYLDDSEPFRERALVVRYRDLVSRPRPTLAAVAERAGLQPTTRRLRVPDAPNVEGQGVRNVRDSRVEMVTDADQRARDRLPPDETRRIDEALAPLMARLEAVALDVEGG